MQTGLGPADRKILGIAGGLLAGLTLATILAAPVPEVGLSSVPSSYLSTPGGARAAYLLLRQLGVDVQRWQEPPFRLSDSVSKATLVIAEPTETPSRAEEEALRRFVVRGGRVVFCGAQLPSFFSGVRLRKLPLNRSPVFASPDPVVSRMDQYRPVRQGQDSQAIELRASIRWQKFGPSQLAVYGRADDGVVVAWTLGAGEIIWWAGAAPLTNMGLNRAGNLPLFLNSVGVQTGRHVYWDEYFHGEHGSLWDYIGRVPAVRWAAVQLALLTCAALFAFGRRSGPVIAPARVSRLSPLEFVETLGGLYRRAKAASVPVDVTVRQLRLQLARRLGLSPTISDSALAHEAAERLGWNGQELESVLDRARIAGAARRFSSAAALDLVQRLQSFTARLTEKRS